MCITNWSNIKLLSLNFTFCEGRNAYWMSVKCKHNFQNCFKCFDGKKKFEKTWSKKKLKQKICLFRAKQHVFTVNISIYESFDLLKTFKKQKAVQESKKNSMSRATKFSWRKKSCGSLKKVFWNVKSKHNHKHLPSEVKKSFFLIIDTVILGTKKIE